MNFLIGFAVSLAFGLIAFFLRTISLSGVIGGVVFGTIIYGCTGWQGFSIPLTFFIIGSLCTKIGYKKKDALGIAQEEGGKRGAKHALANVLAGTIFGVLYMLLYSRIPSDLAPRLDIVPAALLAAMVGSFATAAADTSSSELGQLYGKTPINPLTFKRVMPGTEGAISLEGTLFGILASVIVALVAILSGLFSDLQLQSDTGITFFYCIKTFGIAIVSGAFLGNLIESYIGTFGGKKLNNEFLNFLNTLIGGIISGIIVFFLIQIFIKSDML